MEEVAEESPATQTTEAIKISTYGGSVVRQEAGLLGGLNDCQFTGV